MHGFVQTQLPDALDQLGPQLAFACQGERQLGVLRVALCEGLDEPGDALARDQPTEEQPSAETGDGTLPLCAEGDRVGDLLDLVPMVRELRGEHVLDRVADGEETVDAVEELVVELPRLRLGQDPVQVGGVLRHEDAGVGPGVLQRRPASGQSDMGVHDRRVDGAAPESGPQLTLVVPGERPELLGPRGGHCEVDQLRAADGRDGTDRQGASLRLAASTASVVRSFIRETQVSQW